MLPTVEEISNGKAQVDLDPSLLEDWMCQEMFDVYSVPLLTNEVSTFHIILMKRYSLFQRICLLGTIVVCHILVLWSSSKNIA